MHELGNSRQNKDSGKNEMKQVVKMDMYFYNTTFVYEWPKLAFDYYT